ncbi:type IV secretion system protein [Candidatus Roizmanbacteria bacterium]|nr:MAG: type IV secretion system protein [Candidatus Roizmanbacteria bacterium]
MKRLVLVCAVILGCFFTTSLVHAQEETPEPATQPQVQWTNEFTVQDEPSTIITLLKNFIDGFDSFLGGFIFYTPDPLAEQITLKDESTIPGVTKYRNIFYQIAIPVLAIIISAIAIAKLGSDNAHELKSFAVRFVIVIALFLTVPTVLSYSVQFNNLLVEKISETQEFTGFLNDYFDKSREQIEQNQSSEKFGIPSFDISLQSGIFRSLGKFIVQIFLFALTFLFLLCGFLYIGFQFVIRFATLLFLGVIYPIVIPFALAERTQSILHTFFKTWFTFLIQQPAFVLGFSIATDIFQSILEAQGPSVGMLFFYTGFLFFLGGVNMLVARIFGDVWTAMSGNMLAAVSTRTIAAPIGVSAGSFRKGLVGGSLSNALGRNIRQALPMRQKLSNGSTGNDFSAKGTDTYIPQKSSKTKGVITAVPAAPFSERLSQKGFAVEQENQKQGIVSISGSAYKHENKRSGLITYYPTATEAVQDGVPQEKLQHVELKNEQFIDLSSFHKHNPNPHNFNAMQEAKKKGKEIDFAYINKASAPHKIKHFLDLSEKRNQALNVQGVIVERQAKLGSDSVIRLYSKKSYEKRKDI